MKKVLAICMTLVMVMSMMSMTVLADHGNFVSSPSGNSAPIIIEFESESEDCTALLVVTPYSERETLPEEKKEDLEQAYDEIVKAEVLSDLHGAIAQVAASKGIALEDLAVSDMFDVSYYDCEVHDDHGYFEIVLKPETLKNFVALLHLSNGKWEHVDNAEVTGANRDHLRFFVDDLSPFAIVVDTEPASSQPGTNDPFDIMPYVIVMVISASAAIVLWKKSRRQSA
jgi:hypothetical protein